MYPELEDIKLFLSDKPGTGANWHELVPAYQRLCVDQLVLEVERLRHLSSGINPTLNNPADFKCNICGGPHWHDPDCPNR